MYQVIPYCKPYSQFMKIGAILQRKRKAAGLSQQKVAEHFNITATSVSEWERDETLPGLMRLPDLADLYSCSMAELMGEVASDRPGLIQSTLAPILAWEHESDLPPGEFIMVPRLHVLLSAGNGHEQVEIEFVKKQPQAFRADWIRQERLKPSKLASMSADGDSMQPGIFDGDALVVDTSQDTIIDGKVFAIWYDGGERVKRLYRLPGGGLRIKSDNPLFETIEVKPDQIEHVRIIGRVVHRAGKGGL